MRDELKTLLELYKKGKIQSMIPFLPFFYLKGQPLSSKEHYQLEPMYKLQIPRRTLLMTARQCGRA